MEYLVWLINKSVKFPNCFTVLSQHSNGDTEENHKRYSQYSRDSNTVPPKYKSRSLPLHRPACCSSSYTAHANDWCSTRLGG